MTHIDNVLANTQHDTEFIRFLKELGIRNRFYKTVLMSKCGRREEMPIRIAKCDYILSAFLWYGYWNDINDYWKSYVNSDIKTKREIINSAKNRLYG